MIMISPPWAFPVLIESAQGSELWGKLDARSTRPARMSGRYSQKRRELFAD